MEQVRRIETRRQRLQNIITERGGVCSDVAMQRAERVAAADELHELVEAIKRDVSVGSRQPLHHLL